MIQWLQPFLTSLGGLGILGGALFALTFALLSMCGLPLIPFAIMGGVFFGIGGGLAGVIAGSTLGAAGGFLCSRYLARERFSKFLQKHAKFALIDQAIRRDGWWIVTLLRMSPIPFGLSNFCYGLTNIRFPHYLAATVVGMLPGEVVFVSLGATGQQWIGSPGAVNSQPAVRILFYIGLVAMVSALFAIRRIVTRRIEPHEG